MDRKQLIEAAAKAILNELGGLPNELETMHFDAAEAALAVFEGAGSFLPIASDVQETAHTDDERDGLEKAIRLSLRFDMQWSPDEARSLASVLVEPVYRRLAELHRTAQGDDRISRAIDALAWRPDRDGSDPARVQDDYMRRAQAADEALAILTLKNEGGF